MGFLVSIDKEDVAGKLTQLEELCDNIDKKMEDIKLVEDSFSEGDFYDGYISNLYRLRRSMEVTKNAMLGYINVLRYATENYNDLDSELSSALKK